MLFKLHTDTVRKRIGRHIVVDSGMSSGLRLTLVQERFPSSHALVVRCIHIHPNVLHHVIDVLMFAFHAVMEGVRYKWNRLDMAWS